jgi:hypothetical protein
VSPNGKYELDLTNDGQVLLYDRGGRLVSEIASADPHPELVPDPPDPVPDPG